MDSLDVASRRSGEHAWVVFPSICCSVPWYLPDFSHKSISREKRPSQLSWTVYYEKCWFSLMNCRSLRANLSNCNFISSFHRPNPSLSFWRNQLDDSSRTHSVIIYYAITQAKVVALALMFSFYIMITYGLFRECPLVSFRLQFYTKDNLSLLSEEG